MVPQSMVEAHARRINSLVSVFSARVSQSVEEVVNSVVAHVSGLSVEDGRLSQTQENATAILGIEVVFQRALNVSGFYENILAFVANFSDQVDEFREMHAEMGLIPFSISQDGSDILAEQAGMAVAVLEAQVFKITAELRLLLSRSLGTLTLAELVQGTSEVMRRLTRVEPLARDQVILFFRMVGDLAYQSEEDAGGVLEYRYVGASNDSPRDFCSSLLGSNKSYSRVDILNMDNGQVAGVFHCGGGYGCMHWFEASYV